MSPCMPPQGMHGDMNGPRLSGMDLRTWIVGEHDAVLSRFERSIVGIVPLEQWREQVGSGGSSIAFLMFHTTYHEDLAVNAVLGRGGAMMAAWRARLGLTGFAAHAGLGE